MRKFLVFILILSVAIQSFSKLPLWIELKMNQDYIAKNLCVQKEVEDNCCQGSCHLKEKMEEDDKNQETQTGNFKNLKEIQLFHETKNPIQLINPISRITVYCIFQNNNLTSYSSELFHPPNYL